MRGCGRVGIRCGLRGVGGSVLRGHHWRGGKASPHCGCAVPGTETDAAVEPTPRPPGHLAARSNCVAAVSSACQCSEATPAHTPGAPPDPGYWYPMGGARGRSSFPTPHFPKSSPIARPIEI